MSGLYLESSSYVCRKKKKRAKEVVEIVEKTEEKSSGRSKKTPAELAFTRVQEKRVSL